ncbi:MAG: hypothetical protein ACTSRI_12585 [Promethearchaeota archaeon]
MIIYLTIMTLSAQPAILWFWYFYQLFPVLNLTFYILFPLFFFIGVVILILSSIIVAKIFLIFINFIHEPREGVFILDKKDKDYCYWSLRAIVKKWPVWIARQFSLPSLEILALKVFGVKTSTSNSLHEAWVDCEFIESGKNIKIGQGSIIMSNMIVNDKLIVKKVVLKDNIIIGAHSIVLPGTIIESNTILDSISMTTVNQHLEGNSVYRGSPAKKMVENDFIKDKEELENIIFNNNVKKQYDEGNLRSKVKELSIPFLFYIISGFLIIGLSFLLPGFLFILYIFEILEPNLLNISFSFFSLMDVKILILLFLTPLIIIGIYLFHLFFVALFTRWFYRYADKRGATQGVFDRNLDAHSKALDYYHVRSFLFKYPIYAFYRSPFPWLLNWELRFIGSNKIGKGTVFEESYIHSHNNFGDNCYIGTFAHITNHLVDGVYGLENLTFFGVNVGNNSIINALTGGLPGTEIGENSTILPMGTTIKFDKLEGNNVYAGFPAKPIPKKDLIEFLGGEYDGE